MIEKINIAVLSVIYMYKYPIFLRNFTSRYRKKTQVQTTLVHAQLVKLLCTLAADHRGLNTTLCCIHGPTLH